jgi:hypothetical protein
MYIKEVSIDGFKSYAQRVCLTNFDPGFNAITGLNGSGKSNILDSLCFVMGIKNLSAVRNSSSQPGMPAALASSCCDLGVHSSTLSCVYTTVFHTLHILKQPHMLVNIWQIVYPATALGITSQQCFASVPSASCMLQHTPLWISAVSLQVRAANLQELVYKQGSAGITKATVSIVFENNDPANGPSGYEDKTTITVTRQVSRCWHLQQQQRQRQQCL